MHCILSIASLVLMFGIENAWAYLDPGSGSMYLQIILGGIAGLVVALRLYWKRLKSFIFRNKDIHGSDK